MSSGLSQAALRSCASCAAFGDQFRRLSISHWSLPLFYRGWITAMRHWLASRPACLTVSSLSSTRLPGLLLDLGARSILQTPERIKFKLAVIVYRALHGAAPQYLSDQLQYVDDLPTRRRGLASAYRLPIFSTSARRDVLLSAIGRLQVCYRRPSTLEQSTC